MGGEGGRLAGQKVEEEKRGRGGVGASTLMSGHSLQMRHHPQKFGWAAAGERMEKRNLKQSNDDKNAALSYLVNIDNSVLF